MSCRGLTWHVEETAANDAPEGMDAIRRSTSGHANGRNPGITGDVRFAAGLFVGAA